MKKVMWLVLSVFLVAGFAGTSHAEGKMGFVDLAKVFDSYQKTKELDKALEAKGAGKQADRTKMVNEIKKMRDEAELLSAKAKEESQIEVDEKIKALREFDRTTRDALRKERDVMVRDILKEIEAIIKDLGKSEGYSTIFNDRVLLYKSEKDNLTEKVIKALNKVYSKK